MSAANACHVEARDVYGTTKLYPVSRAAQLLADLAGTKTLDARALAIAAELGLSVDVDGSQRQVETIAARVAKARALLGKGVTV